MKIALSTARATRAGIAAVALSSLMLVGACSNSSSGGASTSSGGAT